MDVPGRVSWATACGPRSHQEDRFVIWPVHAGDGANGQLLALMDGHGGSEAAEICRQSVPEGFRLAGVDDLEPALRSLVAWLDTRTRTLSAGTTLTLACVLESAGWAGVAMLGDSPVVARDRNGKLRVWLGHNVRTNVEERRRAEARGGEYRAGYITDPCTGRGLQVARALGDCALEGILAREPCTAALELGPGSFLALLSDGILGLDAAVDPGLVREAAKQLEPPSAGAEDLLRWATGRGLQDNATAVVWKARKAAASA